MTSTTLLEFARGPALTWAIAIFVVGVVWRLVGILLLRTKKDLSEPRNAATWKGLRLIALRSWPRREFLEGTAFGEVMGYTFHVGFLVALLFLVPHVLFFENVFEGLLGFDFSDVFRFPWPTLPTGPAATLSCASSQVMNAAVSSVTSALVRLFIAALITADIGSLRRGMSKRQVPSR